MANPPSSLSYQEEYMNALSLYRRRAPLADFDALVRNAFGQSPWQANDIHFTPAAETRRDGDDVLVRLELPGIDVSNDVSVEAAGGRLLIRGERREETSQNDNARIRAIRYRSCERSFALPSHASAEDIWAAYDAGVRTVRVAGVYAGAPSTPIEITQNSNSPQDSTQSADESAQSADQS